MTIKLRDVFLEGNVVPGPWGQDKRKDEEGEGRHTEALVLIRRLHQEVEEIQSRIVKLIEMIYGGSARIPDEKIMQMDDAESAIDKLFDLE